MPAIIPPDAPIQGAFHPLDTHVELTAGSDAKQADGSALVWFSASWPNLAGATLSMVVGESSFQTDPSSSLPLVWTGQVPLFPSSPSAVHLDVPGASTASLPGGQYDYVLNATLVNGDRLTLASGHLSVIAPPGVPS